MLLPATFVNTAGVSILELREFDVLAVAKATLGKPENLQLLQVIFP